MEESLMLHKSKRRSLLVYKPPNDLLKLYFEGLENNQPLYACVVSGEDTPRLFLEKDVTNAYGAIVRIFFKQGDVAEYMDRITQEENINGTLKYWDVTFPKLVATLGKIDRHLRNKQKGGLQAIASTFVGEKMVNVDVLWTSEPDSMV